MRKKYIKIFLLAIIALSLFLSGCSNNNQSKGNESSGDYNASMTSYYNNTDNVNEIVESEISSFSTKIYTPNDEARQNNLRLTCSTLNETIVKSRRNFFFL